MALYLVSYSIRDSDGDRKQCQVYFDPGAATLAQILTWVTAVGDLVDAVTAGVIEAVNLSLTPNIAAGWKDTPAETTDIQRGALLKFDADNTQYGHSIFIPAAISTVFTNDTVDLNNAAVQAFTDYITTITNGIVGSDKYANDLLAVTAGVKTFRK